MKLSMYIVDAFSSRPFGGNPAAVCLDDTPDGLDKETMMKIAAEMNLSETVYIRRLSSDPADSYETGCRFGLRWFTPTLEVKLCGHGTMASAATLFYCHNNPAAMLSFDTLSGRLDVQKDGDLLQLNLPLDPPKPLQDKTEYEGLLKFLPGNVVDVQHAVHNEMLIVRLNDTCTRKDLEAIKAPGSSWQNVAYVGEKVLAVGVTVRAADDDVDADGKQYDFLSRFFGIDCGVDEDPVTGALHTILSAYWMKILDKSHLYAHQCSLRGGDVDMKVKDEHRVIISGPATVILRGNIQI